MCNGTPFTVEKMLPQTGIEPRSLENRPVLNPLSYLGSSNCWDNDGWVTWDFMSFSTEFQSYQDDERVIMKGCVQWTPVKILTLGRALT